MRRQTLVLLAGLGAAVGLYLWLRSRATAADPTGGASNFIGGAVDTVDMAASRVVNAIISRGYRNNNPGNLRYVVNNPWQGQIGNDAGYGIYDTPDNGVRALGHQLMAYRNRGLNTVRQIITTWAPATENNTSAYVGDVATSLDLGPDEPFDVQAQLAQLAGAIARHENGYLDSGFNMQSVYLA